MDPRTADAEWQGNLEEGRGTVRFGDGRFEQSYTAGSRFEQAPGTNPEELIAAAHASCFSMALAHTLAEAGTPAETVRTTAAVHLEKTEDGFAITRIDLRTEAAVSDIENDTFQEHAEEARATCPVSTALAGCEISLDARLL